MVVDMYHLKIHIILYNYTETKLTIYCQYPQCARRTLPRAREYWY